METPHPDLPARFSLYQVEETGSTNDLARQLAEEGAPSGTLVRALRQTAGRGRRGRSWQSGRGNLFCSLLIRPDLPAAEAAKLSFVAALAVQSAVRELTGGTLEVMCKWPNDVLVGHDKLAGILLEASGQSAPDWVIIGVGMNVAGAPDLPDLAAVSLSDLGYSLPVPEVLQCFARQLDHWLCAFERHGFAPIRQAWLNVALGLGQPVTARLSNGRHLQGRFDGLDADGCLLLCDDTGKTRLISAGEVFLC